MYEHGVVALADDSSMKNQIVVIVDTLVEKQAGYMSLHHSIITIRLATDSEGLEKGRFSGFLP